MTDRDIQALLKSSLPLEGDAELQRDLWPEMLKRMQAEERLRIRFAAWDWAIAGLVTATIFIFPRLIPGLLYHL